MFFGLKEKSGRQKGSIFNSGQGFTLMETIGVLAIIVILAGMMIPPILKRIFEARRTAEQNDLYIISEVLKEEILNKKTIPSTTDWAAFVANRLNKPATEITKSRRIMVVDPQLQISSPSGKLPYTQTTNGTAYPRNSRIMFISNLSLNPNSPAIPADIGSDPIKFQLVWDTPDGSVPPGWPADWYGKGEKLVIQRMELSSLFVRLVVQVVGGTRAYISIDGSQPFSISSTNRFYLKGTPLGLYDAVGTKLLEHTVLYDDATYIFNGVSWSTDVGGAMTDTRQALGRLVDTFLSAPVNPDSKFGSTQQYLINDLCSFMLIYSRWAADGFSDYGSNSDQQVPENVMLEKAQQRIDDTSGNLIW